MDGVYESAFICATPPSAPPSQCPLHFIDFLFIIPTLPSSLHRGIIAQISWLLFLSFLKFTVLTNNNPYLHLYHLPSLELLELILRAWYVDITEDAEVSSPLMSLNELFYPEMHLLACKCVNRDSVVEHLKDYILQCFQYSPLSAVVTF